MSLVLVDLQTFMTTDLARHSTYLGSAIDIRGLACFDTVTCRQAVMLHNSHK